MTTIRFEVRRTVDEEAGCPDCGFSDCCAFNAGEPCDGAESCDVCGSITCLSARLGLECDAEELDSVAKFVMPTCDDLPLDDDVRF